MSSSRVPQSADAEIAFTDAGASSPPSRAAHSFALDVGAVDVMPSVVAVDDAVDEAVDDALADDDAIGDAVDDAAGAGRDGVAGNGASDADSTTADDGVVARRRGRQDNDDALDGDVVADGAGPNKRPRLSNYDARQRKIVVAMVAQIVSHFLKQMFEIAARALIGSSSAALHAVIASGLASFDSLMSSLALSTAHLSLHQRLPDPDHVGYARMRRKLNEQTNLEKFRRTWRFSRDGFFTYLLPLFAPAHLARVKRGGRPNVPSDLVLACGVYYLAHSGSIFDSAENTFDISPSSFDHHVNTVFDILCSDLVSTLVPGWTQEDKRRISTFYTAHTASVNPRGNGRGISGAIGAMDGVHFQIDQRPLAPANAGNRIANSDRFYSRYGCFTVVVVGVCDPSHLLRAISGVYPGRAHDQRVASEMPLMQQPEQILQTFGDEYFLLVDSGFTLPCTIAPFNYKDSNLDDYQRAFSKVLSHARADIECCWADIWHRFPRLRRITSRQIPRICRTVFSGLLLHNASILCGDLSIANRMKWLEMSDADLVHELGDTMANRLIGFRQNCLVVDPDLRLTDDELDLIEQRLGTVTTISRRDRMMLHLFRR